VSALDVRVAVTGEDVAEHHRVRHEVFVREQAIFAVDDRDGWDEGAVKVVARAGGRVLGAVRLYPLDEAGLWKGDRLAVLPEGRRLRIGAPLVRFAVATAGERGGHTMVAQIQLPNVRFFEHLGWHADGPAGPYHGVMHQPMAIPLAAAP
jgi:putative N-acetyltransferase (TIGR04045 family)